MKEQSKLKETIKQRFLSASQSTAKDDGLTKSVTIRLSLDDYAKLKVLANRLKESPTPLAKTIFLEGLHDAVNVVFDLGEDVGEFAVEVEEETILLAQEAA